MTPHVQAVMDRYRGLKAEGLTGLEASVQTRQEFRREPVTQTVTQHGVTHDENVKLCNVCKKEFSGRGGACNACRQRAYRERSK